MSCKFPDVFKFMKEIVSKRYGINHPSRVLVRSEKFLAVVPVEGTKYLILKKEEPKTGPLISKAPNAIEFNIKCIKYGPNYWIHAEAFERRYPVQYLNDDYSDRPEESNILDNVFKKMHIQKFMETLKILKEVDPNDSSDENEDSSTIVSSKSSDLKENLKELVKYTIGMYSPNKMVDKNLIQNVEDFKYEKIIGEDSNDDSKVQLVNTQDSCTQPKLLSESPDLMDYLKKYGINNLEEGRQINNFMEEFDETKEENRERRDGRKNFSIKESRSDNFSELVEILKNLAKFKLELDASDSKMETLENIGEKRLSESERFLTLIYEMGRKNLAFTEEEKKEIAPLISEVLSETRYNALFHIVKCFHYRNIYGNAAVKAAKRKRSLQHLIDGYSNCPVESTILAEKLKENDILELIELLDAVKDDYDMLNEYELLDTVDDDDDLS